MGEKPLCNLIVRCMGYQIIENGERKPYRPTEREFEFMDAMMLAMKSKKKPTLKDINLSNWTDAEIAETYEKMTRIEVNADSVENFFGGGKWDVTVKKNQ